MVCKNTFKLLWFFVEDGYCNVIEFSDYAFIPGSAVTNRYYKFLFLRDSKVTEN